jgi:hypothetical protein
LPDITSYLGLTARRLAAPIPYWRWFRLPADRALERSLAEINRAVSDSSSRRGRG